MKKSIFITLMFFTVACYANMDTLVVEKLDQRLIKVSNQGDSVSFSFGSKENHSGVFIHSNDPGEWLRICTDEITHLWVQGRLIDQISNCEHLKKDSLFELFGADTLFIVLGGYEKFNQLSVDLVDVEKSSYEHIRLRANDHLNDFVIVFTLLLISVLIIFSSQIRDVIGRTLSMGQSSIDEIGPQWTFLSFSQTAMILIIAIQGAYIALFGQVQSGLISQSLQELISMWFRYVLAIMGFLILKYVIIFILSRLFKVSSMATRQFVGFIDISYIITALIAFLLLIDYWLIGSTLGTPAIVIDLVFPVTALLYLLIIYFGLTRYFTSQKLHLISYLCTTEFIPAFFIANKFLG